MLAQMQANGSMPTYDKLNSTDKVLFDNATGSSAYQTASDLQNLLQDQGLRDRLKNDQCFTLVIFTEITPITMTSSRLKTKP